MKICRADPSSVGQYHGLPKFLDLENWLINLVILLEAIQYGGANCNREHMLCIPEFLTGEAKRWYAHHIVHVNHSQLSWTFKDVIVGLYDHFTHPTTMQEAQDTYAAAKYSSQLGIQGFYDTLIDQTQNMSVYSDTYKVVEAASYILVGIYYCLVPVNEHEW